MANPSNSDDFSRLEELEEGDKALEVHACDQFVSLLRKLHPEHDRPGVDDVADAVPKKRDWKALGLA